MWPSGRAIVGMGCMRLSTEPDRDDDNGVEVIHAALDAGVTLLDTADAYCRDDSETGHNERLIARALASWPGDRQTVLIATKGGLTRPQGSWVPDGRARHLQTACEASLRALGLERIPLYQLHAPDPRTPLATSVRALNSLKEQGLVSAIGLCNLTLSQIEEARRITEVAAVQVELSPWRDDAILDGVVAFCIRHGIRVLAHRPFGGAKGLRRAAASEALRGAAARHGVTAAQVILAWLQDLSPALVPLPGATSVGTARSIATAQSIHLSDADRAALDSEFPAAPLVRLASHPAASPAAVSRTGDVVLIMGLPGAGKSTLARRFVDDGYVRLNRDERGGTLKRLLPALDRAASDGHHRIVLDNTYVTRRSRAAVLLAAARHPLAVRCLWVATELDDAQVNAVERMLAKHGRLLEPDEIRRAARRDPNTFAPGAQFRAVRELEPPAADEGFSAIERLPFVRERDVSRGGRAVIVWCDGILWRSKSGGRVPSGPDDVEIVPGRGEVLRQAAGEGARILGISWQPGITQGSTSVEAVDAAVRRLREQLGVDIEVVYCPHAAGPPICWCRKPLPGLGVLLIRRFGLNPASCVYVGEGPQDQAFARKLGWPWRESGGFFSR